MIERNIAVIGTGYWGQNHVRVFHEIGALKTVCDINSDKLNAVLQKYQGIYGTSDLEEVLQDKDVKGVVIATQAETHYDIALKALRNGKDVLVEKPLSLKVEQACHLYEISQKSGQILMVGHLLLYHPAILKIKEFIERNELGSIYYIYSNRLNLGKIRREENILWSFAPHDISVVLELLNERPILIKCMGEAYLQPNIHDVTMTMMKFNSGAMAYIHVSWLHPFKEHRLVVVGSKKMIVFQDTIQSNKLLLYDQRVNIVNGIPQIKRHDGVPINYSTNEPLKQECLHFLECIKSRRQPKTDGQNGIEVLKVLGQAQKDLDRGR